MLRKGGAARLAGSVRRWKGMEAARQAGPACSTAGPSSNPSDPILLGRVELLPGILDLLDGLELDIGEVVALLLDAADVDVLHHLPRLRIDHDGPARAFPVLPPPTILHPFFPFPFPP